MAFPKYIAWLNGTSVARGARAEVEARAREIAATPLWLSTTTKTEVRITTDGSQKFVAAFTIEREAVA